VESTDDIERELGGRMLAEAHESDARAARETKDFLSTINAASGASFSQRENTGTTPAAATKERFSVTAWKARENSFRERHDMGPLRHLTHEKRQRQRLQKWRKEAQAAEASHPGRLKKQKFSLRAWRRADHRFLRDQRDVEKKAARHVSSKLPHLHFESIAQAAAHAVTARPLPVAHPASKLKSVAHVTSHVKSEKSMEAALPLPTALRGSPGTVVEAAEGGKVLVETVQKNGDVSTAHRDKRRRHGSPSEAELNDRIASDEAQMAQENTVARHLQLQLEQALSPSSPSASTAPSSSMSRREAPTGGDGPHSSLWEQASKEEVDAEMEGLVQETRGWRATRNGVMGWEESDGF